MLRITPIAAAILFSSTISTSSLFAQETDRNKLPEIGAAGASILSIEKERQIGDIAM